MRMHKESCYLVESHELYFKLLVFEAIASPKMRHLKLKKKKEKLKFANEKTYFTIKLHSSAKIFEILLIVEQNSRRPTSHSLTIAFNRKIVSRRVSQLSTIGSFFFVCVCVSMNGSRNQNTDQAEPKVREGRHQKCDAVLPPWWRLLYLSDLLPHCGGGGFQRETQGLHYRTLSRGLWRRGEKIIQVKSSGHFNRCSFDFILDVGGNSNHISEYSWSLWMIVIVCFCHGLRLS